MKSLATLIVGIAIGFGLSAASPAWAASLVGGNGYLSGWTVTLNGEEICYMPYIWVSMKEIECD